MTSDHFARKLLATHPGAVPAADELIARLKPDPDDANPPPVLLERMEVDVLCLLAIIGLERCAEVQNSEARWLGTPEDN